MITTSNDHEYHTCHAHRSHAWIIWQCSVPGCGYRRCFNMNTRETVTTQGADPYVLHQGWSTSPKWELITKPINEN